MNIDILNGKKHIHFIGIGGSGMYPLAQILHTPAQAGPAGARAEAEAKAAEKGWFYMDWLRSDDNPTYHRRVTGPALVRSIAREGSSKIGRAHV